MPESPSPEHPVDPERVARAREDGLSAPEAERLAELLGVLGDRVRARIVTALGTAEELCVGDLALALDASEDSVSYALRILRAHGLVRRRTEGRMGFYSLADDATHAALVGALRHLDELGGPRRA